MQIGNGRARYLEYLLLYVRLQYQSRDRIGVRSPALQQNQRPQSRVEGWVAQEEGSVASASQARAPSAAGPLKQQYQAAVAFLQEIFSKVRTEGIQHTANKQNSITSRVAHVANIPGCNCLSAIYLVQVMTCLQVKC